jgi:acyl-CoA hydrolase
MVAVDENMKPSKIPQFTPVNDEEQNMWNAAQKAREMM